MYTKEQIEIVEDGEFMARIVRETIIESIAAACHLQNRTYCQMIGDDSQPLWLDAPTWQMDSAIAGIKQALENPNPAASHESWLEHKRADGWTYGEVKDPEAKTHHCMVPYSDLPEEQKKKDELYINMVQQLGLVTGLIRIKK